MVVTRPVIMVVTRDRPCAVTMVVTRDSNRSGRSPAFAGRSPWRTTERNVNLRGETATGAERPIARGVPVNLVVAVVPLEEQSDANELLDASEVLPSEGPTEPRCIHDPVLFLGMGVSQAAQPGAGGDLEIPRV
jgi:hypothetical protein